MSEQELFHPLVESLSNAENNWGYGDEETVRCALCGKRFDARDAREISDFWEDEKRYLCLRCARRLNY